MSKILIIGILFSSTLFGATASVWSKDATYKQGSLIIYQQNIYECGKYPNWCNQRSPGSNGWLQAWSLSSLSIAEVAVKKLPTITISSYKSGVNYKVGDVIAYNGSGYECAVAGWCAQRKPGSSGWTAAWKAYKGGDVKILAEAPKKAFPFSSSKTYALGDLIVYNNETYECSVAAAWCNQRAPGSNGWEVSWVKYSGKAVQVNNGNLDDLKDKKNQKEEKTPKNVGEKGVEKTLEEIEAEEKLKKEKEKKSNDKNTSKETSKAKIGAISLAWDSPVKDNTVLSKGDKLVFKWIIYAGSSPYTYNAYLDDVLFSTGSLLNNSKASKKGTLSINVDFPLNTVSKDIKLEFCDADKKGCVSKIIKNIKLTGTKPAKRAFNSPHMAVGYFPSYKQSYANAKNYRSSHFVNVDPLYSHIVASFGKATMSYQSGDKTLVGTGLEFGESVDILKKEIQALKQKSVKVYLAIGGAGYNGSWSALLSKNMKNYNSIKSFIKDMDFDGIDLDYEISGTSEKDIQNYYIATTELYKIAQELNIEYSIAAWSTGADCTRSDAGNSYCANKVSFWGGNAGRERKLFAKLRANGYEPNEMFNFLSIMSYDAGYKHYDPLVAYEDYANIYKGKINIGAEIAKEAWGGAELAGSNEDAKKCPSDQSLYSSSSNPPGSTILGSQYEKYSVAKPYSVERMVNFARSKGDNVGLMVWTVKSQYGGSCSGVTSEQYASAVKKYLTRDMTTYTENLKDEANVVYEQIANIKSSKKYATLLLDVLALENYNIDESAIDLLIQKAKNAKVDSSISALKLKEAYEKILSSLNLEIDKQLRKAKTAKVLEESSKKIKAEFDFQKNNIKKMLSLSKKVFTDKFTDILNSEVFMQTISREVTLSSEIQKTKKDILSIKDEILKSLDELAKKVELYSATQSDENLKKLKSMQNIVKKTIIASAMKIRKATININSKLNELRKGEKAKEPKLTFDSLALLVGDGVNTGYSASPSEDVKPIGVESISNFDVKVSKNIQSSNVEITLMYTGKKDINLQDATVTINTSHVLYQPTSSILFSSDNSNEMIHSTQKENVISDTNIANEIIYNKFGENDKKILRNNDSLIIKYTTSLDSSYRVFVSSIKIIPTSSSSIEFPTRTTPVSLKVKGYGNTLKMGTVTDNSMIKEYNLKLAKSGITSIFKYEGDGLGDKGRVIEPTTTLKTIAEARYIEQLSYENKTDYKIDEKRSVLPLMVVYTANGSGGGVAQEDIKTNYKFEGGVIAKAVKMPSDDVEKAGVTKHYRNLIRMLLVMQAQKDEAHTSPVSVVLNPDLFGEWQKNMINGTFQKEYCGGASDKDCKNPASIDVKGALKTAIDAEKDYIVKKLDDSKSPNYKSVKSIGVFKDLHNLDELKQEIDSKISNDIFGWVKSQNLLFKKLAPDVTYGWLVNLWAPGSALWVHKKYDTDQILWDKVAQSVASFIKFIKAYDNEYSPDFLAFDKYERDGFSPYAKANYAFSSRAWDNYLRFVKLVTDSLDTPAMLWQVPGGHMAAKSENFSGDNQLCKGKSIGCQDIVKHSASGGTYFMGDKNIGTNIDNILDDVLGISLNNQVYNYKIKKGTVRVRNIKDLLGVDENYDWAKGNIEKSIQSNVFAILWGGGSTTGAVAISTCPTGGSSWLGSKIQEYSLSPQTLYTATQDEIEKNKKQLQALLQYKKKISTSSSTASKTDEKKPADSKSSEYKDEEKITQIDLSSIEGGDSIVFGEVGTKPGKLEFTKYKATEDQSTIGYEKSPNLSWTIPWGYSPKIYYVVENGKITKAGTIDGYKPNAKVYKAVEVMGAINKEEKTITKKVKVVLCDPSGTLCEHSKSRTFTYAGKPIEIVGNDKKATANATGVEDLDEKLKNSTSAFNSKVLFSLVSGPSGLQEQPSKVYKWADFLKSLEIMTKTGISGQKIWLYDESDDKDKKALYAQTAIASFLAQAMHETIQYDACDENNWQVVKDRRSSPLIEASIQRGDFKVNYPLDAACGQVGQDYENYGVDSNGVENPYNCPKLPNAQVSAVTHATWYGAPGPLFAAPDDVLLKAGFLKEVDGKLRAGRWSVGVGLEGVDGKKEGVGEAPIWCNPKDFLTSDPSLPVWQRKPCAIYANQKAGGYVNDGSSKRSLAGCVWWGRGVIQLTGRLNQGKLNHALGKTHIPKEKWGKSFSWANTKIKVSTPPATPIYPNIDFCADPEAICSSPHGEIKWLSGLYFWMKEVQSYKSSDPRWAGWNYKTELKKYVDSDFGRKNYKPFKGTSFIDAVSGIVNRGCPAATGCPAGNVLNLKERSDNFNRVLSDGFHLISRQAH